PGGGLEIRIRELAAIGDGKVRPGDLDRDDPHLLVARGNLGRGKVSRCDVVVVPEAQIDDLPSWKQLPHLRREDAEMSARIGGGLGTGMSRQDVEDAGAKPAVLILLAPDARREVHQRRERPVRTAECPYTGEPVRVDGCVLPDETDRG